MYRSAKQSFERSEQLREQNLQEVEGDKQLALLQFGSYLNYDEHVEMLRSELAELRTEFSATEDEMYRQNDSLQDEVSSVCVFETRLFGAVGPEGTCFRSRYFWA